MMLYKGVFGEPKPEYETVSGPIASFVTKRAAPLRSLLVNIDPVQDLHGYDNPWPAGGGKNKINIPDTVLSSDAYLFNGDISLPSGSYVFSITKDDGVTSISNISIAVIMSNGNNATVKSSLFENKITMLITASESIVSIRVYAVAGTYSKVMLESGTTATAFAPYSNICPISGWSAVNAWRTGENLFDISLLDVIGISVTGNAATATASMFSSKFLNGGILLDGTKIDQKVTLTVTAKCNTENQESSIGLVAGFIFLDGSKSSPSSLRIPNSQLDWGTYTATIQGSPENPIVDLFISYNSKGVYEWTIKDIQFELGSTATPYAPYSGNQYTIQLGQTVYGATLDVTNGVLTVDMAMVDLGTLSWESNAHATLGTYFYASISSLGVKRVGAFTINWDNCLCERYAQSGRTAASFLDGCFTFDGNVNAVTQLQIKDASCQDATAFASAVNGTKLVYELATPNIIPLTPQEISTLQGQNALWADTGDVTVEYRSN